VADIRLALEAFPDGEAFRMDVYGQVCVPGQISLSTHKGRPIVIIE